MLKEPKKNINDFQEYIEFVTKEIVKGISLLSYDELEKVNNLVNSLINSSEQKAFEVSLKWNE